MRKSYFDVPPRPIPDDERKSPVISGDLWIAANNTLVVFHGRRMLTSVKGKTVFRRTFSKTISPSWLMRRINEFAEHVQETKLPRGPRRRQIDKDVAEIAKPIKRVRLKKEIA